MDATVKAATAPPAPPTRPPPILLRARRTTQDLARDAAAADAADGLAAVPSGPAEVAALRGASGRSRVDDLRRRHRRQKASRCLGQSGVLVA